MVVAFRSDYLQITYFYAILLILIKLKKVYINPFAEKLIFSGYLKDIPSFSFAHQSLVLTLLIIVSFLMICFIRSKNISPYKYAVWSYTIFNLLAIYVLSTDQFEILSLLFFLLYGGLVSIILGLKVLSYEPDWFSDNKISNQIKIELVRIKISNWWKGLTILTSILIALFVTALVSWVLAPNPDDLKSFNDFTVKVSFFLFASALPGLIYIYIRVLKQISYFERLLLQL